MEKNNRRVELYKLILSSLCISTLSAFMVYALVLFTENFEHILFHLAKKINFLFFIFPFVGLSLIFFLRIYLFKKRENKGIKEIYDSLRTRHNELKFYKIPSHFLNGFLTVIFGGSTGIEVSTVVASASVGSVLHENQKIHERFRKELICVGVAAGVTALFGSPIAGLLFAFEVILKRISKVAFGLILLSVSFVWILNQVLNIKPIFHLDVSHWNHNVFPYFILLGVLAGLNSVYLTKCVLFFKAQFARLNSHFIRVFLATLIIGFGILFFPALYGDGYHAIKEVLKNLNTLNFSYSLILGFLGLLLIKPILSAITLSAGGDGGVFAPSLFIGAFLGLFLAFILNHYFDAHVIPVNFMLIGMAAVLSASLHAPFTSVFLVCGIVGNFTLIIPILVACLVSKLTAKMLFPYTVYTFHTKLQK
ncbi:MAG: chloride channel protein [Bacteroidota bacterium]